MSAQLAKLENLLTRVQRRAAQPRGAGGRDLINVSIDQKAALADQEATDAQGVAAQTSSKREAFVEAEPLSLDSPSIIPGSLEGSALPPLDELDALPSDLDVAQPDLDAPTLEFSVSEMDDDGDIMIDSVEFDDLPESGPTASNLTKALFNASERPITPPPESVEELISSSARASAAPQPTIEQVGETVELETGASSTHLELDEPILEHPTSTPPDSHGEMSIAQEREGQSELRSAQETTDELTRFRLGEAGAVEARVSRRPVLSTNVVNLLSASRDFSPKSFLDLLDASLRLK